MSSGSCMLLNRRHVTNILVDGSLSITAVTAQRHLKEVDEEIVAKQVCVGAFEPLADRTALRVLSSEELLHAPLTTIPEWDHTGCESQQEKLSITPASPVSLRNRFAVKEHRDFQHGGPPSNSDDQRRVATASGNETTKAFPQQHQPLGETPDRQGWAFRDRSPPLPTFATVPKDGGSAYQLPDLSHLRSLQRSGSGPGNSKSWSQSSFAHQGDMSPPFQASPVLSWGDDASARNTDSSDAHGMPLAQQYGSQEDEADAVERVSLYADDTDHQGQFPSSSSSRVPAIAPLSPLASPSKAQMGSPSSSRQQPPKALPEWDSVIVVDGCQLADEEAAALTAFQPPPAYGSSASLNSTSQYASSPRRDPQEPASSARDAGQVGMNRFREPIAVAPANPVSSHLPALEQPIEMSVVTLEAGTPGLKVVDSYDEDTLQTAESIAADARQFASALAASFTGMGVGEAEKEMAPPQPITPQQVGLSQEVDWSRPAPVHIPEATELTPRGTATASMEGRSEDLQEAERSVIPSSFGPISSPAKSSASRQEQRDALAAAWRAREEEAIAAAAANSDSASSYTAAYPYGEYGDEMEEPAEAHHSHMSHDAALKAASQRPPMPPFDPTLPSYMRPTVNSVTRNSPQPDGAHIPHHRGSPRQGLGALLQPRRQVSSPRGSHSGSDQRYEPVKKSLPPEALGLESVLDTMNLPRAAATEEELLKYSPAPRQEAPVVPGLAEVLIITKSKLELEKEACAAAAANKDSPWSGRPVTPARGEDASAVAAANRVRAEREASATSHARLFAPAHKKPASYEATDTHDGKGLGAVLKKHVSALDRTKIAAKAAGEGSPTARVHPTGSKLHAQQREEWGDMGLLEMQKPHKSRLTREQEAWAVAHGQVYVSPVRKLHHRDRKVHTPGAEPGAPSFMRDTCSSTQKHIDVEAHGPPTP